MEATPAAGASLVSPSKVYGTFNKDVVFDYAREKGDALPACVKSLIEKNFSLEAMFDYGVIQKQGVISRSVLRCPECRLRHRRCGANPQDLACLRISGAWLPRDLNSMMIGATDDKGSPEPSPIGIGKDSVRSAHASPPVKGGGAGAGGQGQGQFGHLAAAAAAAAAAAMPEIGGENDGDSEGRHAAQRKRKLGDLEGVDPVPRGERPRAKSGGRARGGRGPAASADFQGTSSAVRSGETDLGTVTGAAGAAQPLQRRMTRSTASLARSADAVAGLEVMGRLRAPDGSTHLRVYQDAGLEGRGGVAGPGLGQGQARMRQGGLAPAPPHGQLPGPGDPGMSLPASKRAKVEGKGRAYQGETVPGSGGKGKGHAGAAAAGRNRAKGRGTQKEVNSLLDPKPPMLGLPPMPPVPALLPATQPPAPLPVQGLPVAPHPTTAHIMASVVAASIGAEGSPPVKEAVSTLLGLGQDQVEAIGKFMIQVSHSPPHGIPPEMLAAIHASNMGAPGQGYGAGQGPQAMGGLEPWPGVQMAPVPGAHPTNLNLGQGAAGAAERGRSDADSQAIGREVARNLYHTDLQGSQGRWSQSQGQSQQHGPYVSQPQPQAAGRQRPSGPGAGGGPNSYHVQAQMQGQGQSGQGQAQPAMQQYPQGSSALESAIYLSLLQSLGLAGPGGGPGGLVGLAGLGNPGLNALNPAAAAALAALGMGGPGQGGRQPGGSDNMPSAQGPSGQMQTQNPAPGARGTGFEGMSSNPGQASEAGMYEGRGPGGGSLGDGEDSERAGVAAQGQGTAAAAAAADPLKGRQRPRADRSAKSGPGGGSDGDAAGLPMDPPSQAAGPAAMARAQPQQQQHAKSPNAAPTAGLVPVSFGCDGLSLGPGLEEVGPGGGDSAERDKEEPTGISAFLQCDEGIIKLGSPLKNVLGPCDVPLGLAASLGPYAFGVGTGPAAAAAAAAQLAQDQDPEGRASSMMAAALGGMGYLDPFSAALAELTGSPPRRGGGPQMLPHPAALRLGLLMSPDLMSPRMAGLGGIPGMPSLGGLPMGFGLHPMHSMPSAPGAAGNEPGPPQAQQAQGQGMASPKRTPLGATPPPVPLSIDRPLRALPPPTGALTWARPAPAFEAINVGTATGSPAPGQTLSQLIAFQNGPTEQRPSRFGPAVRSADPGDAGGGAAAAGAAAGAGGPVAAANGEDRLGSSGDKALESLEPPPQSANGDGGGGNETRQEAEAGRASQRPSDPQIRADAAAAAPSVPGPAAEPVLGPGPGSGSNGSGSDPVHHGDLGGAGLSQAKHVVGSAWGLVGLGSQPAWPFSASPAAEGQPGPPVGGEGAPRLSSNGPNGAAGAFTMPQGATGVGPIEPTAPTGPSVASKGAFGSSMGLGVASLDDTPQLKSVQGRSPTPYGERQWIVHREDSPPEGQEVPAAAAARIDFPRTG